ncbi:hypothetical protein C2S51_033562 [Perilla frutescens var. frutescens]|nr:hypothetical protein C2S51_033562 [Perilla frutescens var. frutescens]
MGKKLDALLGRSFKPSKLRATARLAVSRLPTLKTQRQGRCSVARSDVVHFLNNANHDRALLRVEQVIMEQNMLDVLVALEGYCHLLVERVNLFEQQKFCPEELLEAVSTLIYASTRCGDFPELLELRAIFSSKFGKEFVLRAVELRNHCGVNPRIIHKLSTRMPSLENKMEVLKEIASENNIQIQLPTSDTKLEEKQNEAGTSIQVPLGVVGDEEEEDREIERGPTPTLTPRRKYRDVADAAQAAFESAAYAAEAARMAVKLSQSESIDRDDPTSPRMKFEKIDPVILNHDLENKGLMEEYLKPNEGVRRSSFSSSSSDEEGDHDVEFDDDLVKSKRSGSAVEPLNINRRPISVRSKWPQPHS